MTPAEQQCVWELMTKQIDALRLRMESSYGDYERCRSALENLERERDKIWRDQILKYAKAS